MRFARSLTPAAVRRTGALALLLPLLMTVPLPGHAGDADPRAPALPPVTSWPHMTVVFRDGTSIQNVTLTWVLDGYLLEAIVADGTVKTLAPSNVKAVLARDGSDMTDVIGAACPASDVDFRLLGKGARVPFTFSIMGDAGAGLAVGSAKGGGSPVLVLLGGVRAAVGGTMHARLGARRQDLEQVPDVGGAARSSAGTDLLLMLGTRLKDPRENDNFGYLEGGLLLTFFDNRFPGEDGGAEPGTLTAAGLAAQGGVVLPLSPTHGLDIGLAAMSRPALIEGTGRCLMLSLNLALTIRGGGR